MAALEGETTLFVSEGVAKQRLPNLGFPQSKARALCWRLSGPENKVSVRVQHQRLQMRRNETTTTAFLCIS
jgi:hypothetical protein